MKFIGLAGPARVGKDTIADYLIETHGFLKFSFSDELYNEVQAAYELEDQSLLRGNDTKEIPTERLALKKCQDPSFSNLGEVLHRASYVESEGRVGPREDESTPLSPRRVLQWWGTEYRRAEDPDYWLKRADAFITAFLQAKAKGEHPEIHGLVNTSVRFENELAFTRERGGEVWHIYRREAEAKHLNTYVSEMRLPVARQDRELFNNGSVDQLRTACSVLLAQDIPFIAVERV